MKHYFITMIVLLFVIVSGCSQTALTSGSKHVTEEMDEAISDYIVQHYKDAYAPTDMQFEVHTIYGTEKQDGVIAVYMHSLYEGFNAATKIEPQAGHSIPAVIYLKKDGAAYSVVHYKEPKDGAEYAPSIQDMFPLAYERLALNGTDHIQPLQAQMEEKAEQWLRERTK